MTGSRSRKSVQSDFLLLTPGRVAATNLLMTSHPVFQFETHRIRKGGGTPRTFYPIVFNDIMGLEPDSNHGARAEDIKLILSGHVMEGYKVCLRHAVLSAANI